ncbi:hypothetical protein CTH_2401 [Carboxydocella thermautotrophica]|nr:hypothetical protein CTH_2401 [Carboxydocella thermautotrophica]
MRVLKWILGSLIVVLVVIVAVGGALVGFNHGNSNGHNAAQQQNQDQMQEQIPKEKPKDASEQTPKIIVKEIAAPEDTLKKMEEANSIIKQGAELILGGQMYDSQPQAGDLPGEKNGGQTKKSDGVDMEKIHTGIYKMAQGLTLLDIAQKAMAQDINQTRQAGVNYYLVQPQQPQSYYYPVYPYPVQPYQNYVPYQYPGTQPNIQPNTQPNTQSNNQMASGHQNASHTGGLGGLANLLNVNSVVYVIYGILFLSLFGIFASLVGFINSLLKPQAQAGKSDV